MARKSLIGRSVRYSREMLARAGAISLPEVSTDIGTVVDERGKYLLIRWMDGVVRKSRPDMVEILKRGKWKCVK